MWSETASRRWKDRALRALALPWDAAFAVRGRLAASGPRGRSSTGGRPARWSSPGGLRVLVVAPHPDDEVAGCGGTLLLHGRRGDAVTVAYATDGRASGALGLGPEEMARRRRDEAAKAARLLDVRSLWIGLPEGAWSHPELIPRLREALRETRPDVVYAPSRVDFHPEHRRVASALGRALDGADQEPRIRVYEVHVPLTSLLVDTVASTAPVAERSRAALEAYGSQLGSLRRTLRMKRYAGRRYGVGTQAEVFWEMPSRTYARIHGDEPEPPSGTAFRGVRRLPWTDPLAYLRGRGERRRLAATAPFPSP